MFLGGLSQNVRSTRSIYCENRYQSQQSVHVKALIKMIPERDMPCGKGAVPVDWILKSAAEKVAGMAVNASRKAAF